MPWKELAVSEQRFALIHQVRLARRPVAQVAREFGVSRKTAYKWLGRCDVGKDDVGVDVAQLRDRSRRPHRSPRRTDAATEQAVVALRRQFNYGPRKIRKLLHDRRIAVPSVRTVASILSRHGCIGDAADHAPPPPPQPFERAAANELWQVDHKAALEVARQRVTPLTVLDDHSRYCLRFEPVCDVTMHTVWHVLWELFGEVGLPDAILCDNAFGGTRCTVGLSWFDVQLLRLDVRPIHGRAYHPQTQGKVERLHGTAQRELIDFGVRRDSLEHFADDCRRWRCTYNTLRPHEALGDLPPALRWKPSTRRRLAMLPQISYPADAVTRRVSHAGDFRYRNARVLVGRGLSGQTVRIEEREHDIAVHYGRKELRVIDHCLLRGPRSDKMV